MFRPNRLPARRARSGSNVRKMNRKKKNERIAPHRGMAGVVVVLVRRTIIIIVRTTREKP